MKMRFFVFLVFGLLLAGCSIKEYKNNESKIIVIRSPQLKYADLGYIRSNGDALRIELYEMGHLVKSIEINNLICVDDTCLLKSMFNEKYLNTHYPTELLQDVILGKTIYEGKNLVKTETGFMQNISDENVDIHYEVQNKEIRFKDRRNGILLKISSPSP